MLKITLLLLFSFFVLPQTLLSETAMKCEAGKCSTGKEGIKKKSIKKDILPPKTEQSNRQTTHTSTPTMTQLFNVRTVKVKKVSSAKEQINYGYIVAQDKLTIDVTARYSGYVELLFADTLYKRVTKGDVLAKVYSPEVYRAKQDYLNSINYNEKRSAPAMLQSAKTNLLLLGVSLQEISTILSRGKVDEFTTIYAPISGWIFEKNINQGSAFNSNKKLFQIINLKRVWVEVKLFQNQIFKLDTLTQFKVNIKGLDRTFDAQKTLLYPMLNPKEATATLRLTIDNPNEVLKPGMYAKVHASADTKSRIVLPRTAVIRKSGTWYAFLATDFKGEYEPIEIQVKPLDNTYYEVIKGLNTGDKVVNNALFMMDSDAQINSIY